MKIKNTSNTVISLGRNFILPDTTVEIDDEGYENNSALDMLVQRGCIEIVPDDAPNVEPSEPAPEVETMKVRKNKKAAQ